MGTPGNNRHNVTLSLKVKKSAENNRNINRNSYGYKRDTGTARECTRMG